MRPIDETPVNEWIDHPAFDVLIAALPNVDGPAAIWPVQKDVIACEAPQNIFVVSGELHIRSGRRN